MSCWIALAGLLESRNEAEYFDIFLDGLIDLRGVVCERTKQTAK